MEYQKPNQHLLHAKGMMVQIHAAVRGEIPCKAHAHPLECKRRPTQSANPCAALRLGTLGTLCARNAGFLSLHDHDISLLQGFSLPLDL